MLNKRPIFVNGFSSGGTTILMNAIASHPEVCTIGEIHHAFKGHSLVDSKFAVLMKCLLRDFPAMVLLREDFFRPRSINPRKNLSAAAQRFVDRILYKEKIQGVNSFFNQFKYRDVPYTVDEIERSRLLGKNVDGMIYSTDALCEMYPDATFVGLVRDGLALCESHLRKGRPAEEIAERYRTLGERLLADSASHPRYTLHRFEDLLSSPLEFIQQLYGKVDLDISLLREVRMQVRRVLDASGKHQLSGGDEWSVVWLEPENLDAHFDKRVNEHQTQMLSQRDRDAFLSVAGDMMEAFGYSTAPAETDEPRILQFPGVAEPSRSSIPSSNSRKAA